MEWQKYLDIIADKLRDLGISDSEMSKPLRTFEQFLIENDGEELRASLDDPNELDEFVQNLYNLIIKRRQKKQQTALNNNINANSAAETVLYTNDSTQLESPATENPEQNSAIVSYESNNYVNNLNDISVNPLHDTDNNIKEYVSDDDSVIDMNETVTMNRVNPDSSHEPQDNSETRTIDTVKCDGTDTGSNQQTYPDTYSSTENTIQPDESVPTEENNSKRKLTRAEKKHEALHMYEDIPPISSNQSSYTEFDPSELDRETQAKGSPVFWILFILTLPITVPIIASVGFAFVAVFAAMAILIVGFFALLAVDIIAGTALSLVGIIYGITQTFTVVPIGLYEIGIGIIIGGAAMLIGILIYNIARRLLPFLCGKWYDFFGFCCRQLKKLFNHLKKESTGI